MKHKRTTPESGFTLLEIIVSVALLSILFGLVTAFLLESSKFHAQADGDADAEIRARLVFSRIEDLVRRSWEMPTLGTSGGYPDPTELTITLLGYEYTASGAWGYHDPDGWKHEYDISSGSWAFSLPDDSPLPVATCTISLDTANSEVTATLSDGTPSHDKVISLGGGVTALEFQNRYLWEWIGLYGALPGWPEWIIEDLAGEPKTRSLHVHITADHSRAPAPVEILSTISLRNVLDEQVLLEEEASLTY
ncbi:MAG TPA: type II secretion system protein [Planctomycetes bacterium]|nr:type II secretion system protein [Planctomycetota bacterium]HIN79511.1 type II secretion system protein [Planctomycetota bacterium]